MELGLTGLPLSTLGGHGSGKTGGEAEPNPQLFIVLMGFPMVHRVFLRPIEILILLSRKVLPHPSGDSGHLNQDEEQKNGDDCQQDFHS